MWPILACSIISLTIIMDRFIFWRRLHFAKDWFICQQILKKLKNGIQADFQESGPVSTLLKAGLNASSPSERTKTMEISAMASLEKMRRGMNILDTVITAAPMLGILGTVAGIILAFNILGANGITDPQGVISGMAQALITTAAGLAVAIGTLFPYNFFSDRIQHAKTQMEIAATELEIIMENKK